MFSSALSITALAGLASLFTPARAADELPAALKVNTRVMPHVLVYTATDGFRHDSIPTAIDVLRAEGPKYSIDFLFTEDSGIFTDDSLSAFDAILFVSVTGTPVPDWGQQALSTYMKKGGSFMGVHAASAAFYNDTSYQQAIGAYFDYHPEFQPATFLTLDKDFPSSYGIPDEWRYSEEVYFFSANPRDQGAKVVMTVQKDSFHDENGGNPNQGDPHPIAWYIENPKCSEPRVNVTKSGRTFYTALGHSNETWQDKTFQQHVFGGLAWTLNGASTRAFGAGVVGNNTPAPPEPEPTPEPSASSSLSTSNNNVESSAARLSVKGVAASTAATAVVAAAFAMLL